MHESYLSLSTANVNRFTTARSNLIELWRLKNTSVVPVQCARERWRSRLRDIWATKRLSGAQPI